MLPRGMAGRLTLDFLKTESSAGLAPVGAAAIALILANSPLAPDYFHFLARPVPVQIGNFAETASVASWTENHMYLSRSCNIYTVLWFLSKLELSRDLEL